MSKRTPWKEAIPQENLDTFESLLDLFCSSNIGTTDSDEYEARFKDLLILPEYKDLFDKPLSKYARKHIYNYHNLLKARIAKRVKKFERDMRRTDTLFQTINSCIELELEKPRILPIQEYRTFGKKRGGLKELGDPLYVQRLRLFYSSHDIICLVEHKHTLYELVILASEGDDESLKKLIRLSRLILNAKFVAERISLADEHNDEEFFESVIIDKINEDRTKYNAEIAKIGFSMIVLWHLGFKELTNPQLRDFLLKRFGYPTQLQPSFNMLLYRLGLVRYRKQ